MTARAYYNEFDPYAAQWLRNLIAAGLIPDGDVDERSITDVQPSDLDGYTQAHFFAGIGGWPYALRLAGWPDDRPVWSGSCPCQPFSVAGHGKGAADERHLWPAFRRLITERSPAIVVGEQVASADGRLWLTGVRADLEGMGYAVGAADLCAAGVGAPHIRQRLFWVADTGCERGAGRRVAGVMGGATGQAQGGEEKRERVRHPVDDGSADGGMAEPDGAGRDRLPETRLHERREGTSRVETSQGNADGPSGYDADGRGESRGLGDSVKPGLEGHAGHERNGNQPGWIGADTPGSTPKASGPWATTVWLPCRDGKARRIESGLEPLVDGVPFKLADPSTYEAKKEASRVAILRGLGNAIVPQVAAEFLMAYLDVALSTSEAAA